MNKQGQSRNAQYAESISQTLANNATGAGATHPSAGAGTARAFVFADQNGTLAIEQSYDGTTWRQTDTAAVTASVGKSLDGKIVRPFARVTFKNTSGAAACSVVELDAGLYT